jgi:hypothetical protein
VVVAGVALAAATSPLLASGRTNTAPRKVATVVAPGGCRAAPGNLVANCDFLRDIAGWTRQAATTVAHDARGHDAPGSLRMTNEPASEAGVGTCVPLAAAPVGGPRATSYELSGWLWRLQGNGECLPFVEEHATDDCSAGATSFHQLESKTLAPGKFTDVSGTTKVSARSVALRVGFACYGEHDDDVSGVLVDDVVLVRVPPAG